MRWGGGGSTATVMCCRSICRVSERSRSGLMWLMVSFQLGKSSSSILHTAVCVIDQHRTEPFNLLFQSRTVRFRPVRRLCTQADATYGQGRCCWRKIINSASSGGGHAAWRKLLLLLDHSSLGMEYGFLFFFNKEWHVLVFNETFIVEMKHIMLSSVKVRSFQNREGISPVAL